MPSLQFATDGWGVSGPTKKAFCWRARRVVGGIWNWGNPRKFGPGASRFVSPGPKGGATPETIEVGSWASTPSGQAKAESGGGFGCGAQEIGWPQPNALWIGF